MWTPVDVGKQASRCIERFTLFLRSETSQGRHVLCNGEGKSRSNETYIYGTVEVETTRMFSEAIRLVFPIWESNRLGEVRRSFGWACFREDVLVAATTDWKNHTSRTVSRSIRYVRHFLSGRHVAARLSLEGLPAPT